MSDISDEITQDEKGVHIRLSTKFPQKFNTTIAARAAFFDALRHMSDEDFKAGRSVDVTCRYRRPMDVRLHEITYRIGGSPRTERSWKAMSAEILKAIENPES
jgi:hypothetical protein